MAVTPLCVLEGVGTSLSSLSQSLADHLCKCRAIAVFSTNLPIVCHIIEQSGEQPKAENRTG